MNVAPHRHEPLLVGLALSAAAIIVPLQLYLLALVLFGLPHVLWEMNWVRHAYRHALPPGAWIAVFGILLLQAAARLGVWSGALTTTTATHMDILTLALLAFLAAGLVRHGGWPRALPVALLALVGGAALLLAVASGNLVAVLVTLAIAHNFTPLLLVPGDRRLAGHPSGRLLGRLFLLPWLVAITVLALPLPFDAAGGDPLAAGWLPVEATWLARNFGGGLSAILSALVLSQCLHYYCVLRLLPATISPNAPKQWKVGAIAASLLLVLYFSMDFLSARQLYAVAAGAHAWLELPLILLLFAGTQPKLSDCAT